MCIDICLAVFDNLKWTQKFIDSVYKTTYSDFQLYITDNGSTDGTFEWLVSLGYGNMNVIKLDRNYGCSRGWNKALGCGQNDYQVLTQNDVQFAKNWDKYLLDFLEQNPSFMAAGSMEIENLDLSQIELDALSDSLKTGGILYGSFPIACVMMRKTIFDDIGYFDENFTTGTFEDYDFIRRCANVEMKFAQIFDSIICHVHGQTSRKYANVTESQKYFLQKWDDKEVKEIREFFNNPELEKMLFCGKIKQELLKEKLDNLNIEYRWIR